ncbi:hypothetical protein EDD37DRAFT_695640 [Exophiala viscosa]|uniref:uncharacterized protein n=1 Tax=Exophiala viscosa TaxID=2486360 RepID=UPI0021990188|nr:hypothetical protein EDD37DRAFT_695640 [Exophiala viscosa]
MPQVGRDMAGGHLNRTPSSTPMSSAAPSEPLLQPYSCLQCKHRKVKCDRVDPCVHCRKAGAECIYRVPPPAKRRKRGYQETSTETGSAADNEAHEAVVPQGEYPVERDKLLEKVRRYETLLKALGALRRPTIGIAKEDEPNSSPGSTMDADGKLVTKYGKSRYLENNLWTSVRDEFQDPNDILEDSSDNEIDIDADLEIRTTATRQTTKSFAQDPIDLVLPPRVEDGAVDLRSLHPQPVQVFMLWQAFVDNVNPMKAIVEATADLRHMSKAMEALLFGVYLIAALSMEDAECQSALQQSKATAIDRFRSGAQEALRAAGILKTSDMMVLQAFVLFLLAARCDAHSLWALTGVSIRIGQRIGLHRDGETLKLPPFETEMRRRLWMIMVQVDCRAAELCGSGLSIKTLLGHTKPPLNVNDCDLYPDMRELPTEQPKATEMMFMLIRSTIGTFLIKELPEHEIFDGVWSTLSNPNVSMAAKDDVINDLEQTLEDKVIRHCDIQVPLHRISCLIARSAICKLRLFAHLPRDAGDSEAAAAADASSSEEENLLYSNSLRMLQYDTEIRTTKYLRRFLWHVDMHFQWHPFIYLLTYLRTHAISNPRTDTAWATIDEVFATHPEIIFGGRARSKLCNAVCSLTFKAWESREMEQRKSRHANTLSKTPSCVMQLRGQPVTLPRSTLNQAEAVAPSNSMDSMRVAGQHQLKPTFGTSGLDSNDLGGFDPIFTSINGDAGLPLGEADAMGMDATPINWRQWDSMCQEFEMGQWDDGPGTLDFS